MPARAERFFWMYAPKMNGDRAASLDFENRSFARSWAECTLHYETCVSDANLSERLWLFRLATNNQKVAGFFRNQLTQHIQNLVEVFGDDLDIKRRSNLPQPLVCRTIDQWPKTDIGLHSVNNLYNGTLISYSYYEERARHHIPHMDLGQLIGLCSRVRGIWEAVACTCHRSAPGCECKGTGCFDCFQLNCPNCDGTGWKDFVAWARSGYQIDYLSGMPMARIIKEALAA
jgi:hypothetical protein